MCGGESIAIWPKTVKFSKRAFYREIQANFRLEFWKKIDISNIVEIHKYFENFSRSCTYDTYIWIALREWQSVSDAKPFLVKSNLVVVNRLRVKVDKSLISAFKLESRFWKSAWKTWHTHYVVHPLISPIYWTALFFSLQNRNKEFVCGIPRIKRTREAGVYGWEELRGRERVLGRVGVDS